MAERLDMVIEPGLGRRAGFAMVWGQAGKVLEIVLTTAIAVVSTISSTFPACPQTIAKPARRPRPGSMTMSRRSAIPLLGLQYRRHYGRSGYLRLQLRLSRQYA